MKLLRELNKAFQKHLLLNTKPSTLWKVIRFFIHWLTLPLKIVLIGSLGLFQILKYSFKDKRKSHGSGNVKFSARNVFDSLPVMKHENYWLYLCRNSTRHSLNGRHHNPDHQASRHGTYTFLATKLGLLNDNIVSGLGSHLLGNYICRGYTIDDIGMTHYNMSSVSGDMLCGLALGLNCLPDKPLETKYETLIASIVNNDYALKEFDNPMSGDDGILKEIFDERLKEVNYDKFELNMKSNRATWSPGIETVGAQALTVLAALRVSDAKFNDPLARKHYKKLLWKYGYGLLSLFPTAYIDSRRGYFNEHNCIMALYILAKNAKYKLFWFLPMLYVWALSKHWNNMYFTGLFVDAYPFMKKYLTNHIEECETYLSEVESLNDVITRFSDVQELGAEVNPVPIDIVYDDEFYPDIRRDVFTIPLGDNKHYTGLGFLADLTMLEVIKNG